MNLSDIAYSDIATLSPPILLAVVLNGVGVFLKRSPIHDWVIPFVLIVLGAAIYPWIADAAEYHKGTRSPLAYRLMVGAAIGVMSVGVHQAIRQFLTRKNDPSVSTGTTFFKRRPQPQPKQINETPS